MDVKDIIRQRRQELGLTYEELGNIIGVGKSTVRKWETGMIENMKRDNIVALAKALNISPALIMGWDIEQNIPANKLKLTKEENQLIYNFKKLNNLGKKEANKRVSELTEINKYIQDRTYLEPLAAHDKQGTFTEEEYKHDIDIMNDDELWDK